MTASSPITRASGPDAATSFILANTKLLAPPLVPEIKLHLAEESLPIWRKTEEELGEEGLPPPYWAFAWAGGQALARYILDNQGLVAGKRVIDLGSGSGLTAIAVMQAGATRVLACDIDAFAVAACQLNATTNGVDVEITSRDVLAGVPPPAEVVLIGDLYYERALADRVTEFARAAKDSGASVIAGDPQRSYFPKNQFQPMAEYYVEVTRELEDGEVKRTAVWQLV